MGLIHSGSPPLVVVVTANPILQHRFIDIIDQPIPVTSSEGSNSMRVMLSGVELDDRLRVLTRYSSSELVLGGKGSIVARLLKMWHPDWQVVEVCPLSQKVGPEIHRLITQTGVECRSVSVEKENRRAYVWLDPLRKLRGEGITAGPTLTQEEARNFGAEVRRLIPYASALVVAGSTPEGAHDELSRSIEMAAEAGVFTLVDTSRDMLERAMRLPVSVLKANRSEMSAVARCDFTSFAQVSSWMSIQTFTAKTVLVTLDGAGLLYKQGDAVFAGRFTGPLEVVNPVGSGDCLSAGIVSGSGLQVGLKEAIRMGISAASANVCQIDEGYVSLETVLKYMPGSRVDELSLRGSRGSA